MVEKEKFWKKERKHLSRDKLNDGTLFVVREKLPMKRKKFQEKGRTCIGKRAFTDMKKITTSSE